MQKVWSEMKQRSTVRHSSCTSRDSREEIVAFSSAFILIPDYLELVIIWIRFEEQSKVQYFKP